jgi:transposase-like protein
MWTVCSIHWELNLLHSLRRQQNDKVGRTFSKSFLARIRRESATSFAALRPFSTTTPDV